MMLAGVKTLIPESRAEPKKCSSLVRLVWAGEGADRQTLSTWEERGEEKREESGEGHAGTLQGRLEKAGTRGPVRAALLRAR